MGGKTIALAAVFAASITLPAFGDVPDNPAAQPAAANPPPKTIWQVGDDQTALNPQSQLQCPATIGDFHRVKLAAFNPFGLDVGCDYETAARDDVTLYLTLHPKDDLAKDFADAKTVLTQRFKNAAPLADADQPTFMSDIDWQHAIYRLSADTETGVWLARMSGWLVEYRATYKVQGRDAVFAFMAALTQTAEKSAGAHIAACASAEASERNGTKIADEKLFPALSLSGVLNAEGALGLTKPSTAANWCAVQGVQIGGANFLLWRNAEKKNAAMDKISPLNEGDQRLIFGITDAIVATLKTADKPAMAYDIVVEGRDGIQLVGVYNGPPALDELARFALPRPVALYASFNAPDKKLTLYKPPLN